MKIVKPERSHSSDILNKTKINKTFNEPYSLHLHTKQQIIKNTEPSNKTLHYLYPMQSLYLTPERQKKPSNKQIYFQKKNVDRQSTEKKPVLDHGVGPAQSVNQQLLKVVNTLAQSINCLGHKLDNLTQNMRPQNSQGLSHQPVLNPQIAIIRNNMEGLSKTMKKKGNIFEGYSDIRYEELEIDVPELPILGKQRQFRLEQYLGIACKQIFSTGFGLLNCQELDSSKVKAFCSQKLISWIIKITNKNLLTSLQIQTMNQCLLTKILPYFSAKYPASDEKGENSMLQSLIVERRNIDDNQNDLIGRVGLKFRYKDSGNYQAQIMKIINRTISIVKQRKQYEQIYDHEKHSKKQTLYGKFKEDMTSLFKKIESKEEVEEMQNYQINKTVFDQDIMSLIKKGSLNQQFDFLRGTCYRSSINNCDSKKKEQNKEEIQQMEIVQNKDEYRENVRLYTNYEINKKISDHIREFTDKEISDGDFQLMDAGMIRILTKWSEQLYNCFDVKNTLEREQPFKMRNGSQSFLQKKWVVILHRLLQQEKAKVQEYKHKITSHMYQAQLQAAKSQVPAQLKVYTEQESSVGQFSVLIVKNAQSYLKGYLNTLIHCICSALNNFQRMIRLKQEIGISKMQISQIYKLNLSDILNNPHNIEYKGEQTSSLVPQLITFKVGDIFRSKCSSKQKQIIALYREIERLNQEKPNIFKIVRVKNKLKEGTKDILVNLLYRQKLLVEVQLAIKSDKSQFIQNSFKFKHYLYELQRSLFGPIQQLCNIWVCKDPRAQFYLKNFDKSNQRKQFDTKISECSHNPKNNISLPFKCSICQYYYEDPKVTTNHKECSNPRCRFHKVCFLCRLEINKKCLIGDLVQNTLPEKNNRIVYYRPGIQGALDSVFPFKGTLLSLNKTSYQSTAFVKLIHGNNLFLLQPDNLGHKFRLLKEINLDTNSNDLKKFLTENLIINEIPSQLKHYTSDNQLNQQVQLSYLLPKYFRSCIKDQKNSITLSHKNLQNDTLFKCKEGEFKSVKRINLSYNKLSSINNIAQYFCNVEILNLNNNCIKRLPDDLTNFAMLQQLELSNNTELSHIPESIFLSPSLQCIELNNCNIAMLNLPKSQYQKSRIKSLKVDDNKLLELPNQISRLEQLEHLSISNNEISSIAQDLGKLKYLKYLNISRNSKLNNLPQCITNVASLQILQVTHNRMSTLPKTFTKLKSLKQLNIANNDFSDFPIILCEVLFLEKLNLINNDLNEIPKQISNLRNLKELIIDQNDEVKELTEERSRQLRVLNNGNVRSQRIQKMQKSLYAFTVENLSVLQKEAINPTQGKYKIKLSSPH